MINLKNKTLMLYKNQNKKCKNIAMNIIYQLKIKC